VPTIKTGIWYPGYKIDSLCFTITPCPGHSNIYSNDRADENINIPVKNIWPTHAISVLRTRHRGLDRSLEEYSQPGRLPLIGDGPRRILTTYDTYPERVLEKWSLLHTSSMRIFIYAFFYLLFTFFLTHIPLHPYTWKLLSLPLYDTFLMLCLTDKALPILATVCLLRMQDIYYIYRSRNFPLLDT